MSYRHRGLAPLSYGLEQDDGSRAVYTHDDEGTFRCIGRLMPVLPGYEEPEEETT